MNQTDSDAGAGSDTTPTQNPHPSDAARRSRLWRIAKPWIVLVVTLFVSFLLIRTMRPASAPDQIERPVFVILMCGIYLAIWMLVSRLERLLKLETQPRNATNSTWHDDWKSAPWWGIGFFLVAIALSQNGAKQQKQIGKVPFSNDTLRTLRQGQATSTYWSTAVAKLHLVRFETPSGQQHAAEYFDQRFGQLRTLTGLAKATSTANVDPELVQMASRHLTQDERWLQLKRQFDQLMRQEKPADASTVDQQSFVWNTFLLALQSDPNFIEKLPRGPERDLIESILVLEQQRANQLHEIDQMQAVLQERYKGSQFPLPSIDQ